MARTKPGQPKDTEDALRMLSEKLAIQAIRPSIFGYKPHPKQEIFHRSTARIRLYIGGNRSGKTTGGITEDVWWLLGDHPLRPVPPPPVRGRIVSVDFLNGIEKIIKPNLSQYLPSSYLLGGSWYTGYDSLTRTLHLENGSFVELMSYDQDLDKFAGTSRHFVHYDEEPPKDIYTECQTRLVDTGGSSWLTMTPVEGMTWVYDDLYMPGTAGNNPNIFVLEIEMQENPYISEGEIEIYRLSLGTDEDDINARIRGQFVQTGGLVYPGFKVEKHVIPQLEAIPLDWQIDASMDHGLNNPTAWLWHAIDPNTGRIITFWEHYKSDWIVDQHAARVKEIEADDIRRTPLIRTGDPSIRNRNPISGTSVQEEYQKAGIFISLGNNDLTAGLGRVRGYQQRLLSDGKPAWMITENCRQTIWEMQRYRWATYANKKVAYDHNNKEVPVKKNDHAMDSLRYEIMSRPELVIPQSTGEAIAMPNPLGAPSPVDVWGTIAQAMQGSQKPVDTWREESEGTQWTTDEFGSDW